MQYLYSMRSDVLECEAGTVTASREHAQVTRFRKLKPTGGYPDVQISTHEAVIHNGYLWLEKRDDAKAIDLFLDYENDILAKREKELQVHRDRIHHLEIRKGRYQPYEGDE